MQRNGALQRWHRHRRVLLPPLLGSSSTAAKPSTALLLLAQVGYSYEQNIGLYHRLPLLLISMTVVTGEGYSVAAAWKPGGCLKSPADPSISTGFSSARPDGYQRRHRLLVCRPRVELTSSSKATPSVAAIGSAPNTGDATMTTPSGKSSTVRCHRQHHRHSCNLRHR